MSKNREIKASVVNDIKTKFEKSKSVVIAEYHGLTVSQIQDLRSRLADKDVDMKVYKNRLFKLAAKELGFDFGNELKGPNTFAFGMSDDISPAKILAEFAKEHKVLKIKTGTYEGKVITHDEVMEVALLPTYDEALTMLAMSLMSPLKYVSVGLNTLATEGHLESKTDSKTPTEEVKSNTESENKETEEK